MSVFSEEFDLAPAKSGERLTADGDWYGDEITVNALYPGGDKDKAIEVLESVHRNWKGWLSDLVDAIEEEHGDPGDFWLEAISAHDGKGVEGYFEIEFSSPDLFGDEIAMASCRIGHGIEEVGISA